MRIDKYMPIIKIKEFVDYLNEKELKDRDLYIQYAEMKNAQKILDERIDEINQIILEQMVEQGEEKKVFDFGGFTVGKRATWKYTEAVKEIEDKVKEVKKEEQEKGLATKEEKPYLIFK